MRILLVSSNSGSRGGGELYLVHLARALGGAGCTVLALLGEDRAMDELAGRLGAHATVIRAPLKPTYRRPLRSLGAAIDRAHVEGLARRLAGIDADVIHVNQQVAEDGLDHLLAARRTGRALVSTIHIAHAPDALAARGGATRRAVARRVLTAGSEPLICVSESGLRRLGAWTGVPGERLHVVHNGVPAPRPAAGAREAVGARHGIAADALRLLLVGRLEAQKSPDRALALLRWLRARDVPVHLLWVGDGSARAAFEGGLAGSGLARFATVTGWRTDVADYLAAADLFLLPSRFEGLPLALIEALHGGLPVLASAVDGIGEAVRDARHGRVLAGWSVEAWGRAVLELAADAPARARMGRAAAREARRRFSLEAMAQGTLAVYGGAPGTRRKAPGPTAAALP